MNKNKSNKMYTYDRPVPRWPWCRDEVFTEFTKNFNSLALNILPSIFNAKFVCFFNEEIFENINCQLRGSIAFKPTMIL